MTLYLIEIVFYCKHLYDFLGLPKVLLQVCFAVVAMEWLFVTILTYFFVPASMEITFLQSRHNCMYNLDISPVNSTLVSTTIPATAYQDYYDIISTKLFIVITALNLYHIMEIQYFFVFKHIIRLSQSLRDMYLTLETITMDLLRAQGTYRNVHRVLLHLFFDFIVFVTINSDLYLSYYSMDKLAAVFKSNALYRKLYLEFILSSTTEQEIGDFLFRTRCIQLRDNFFYALDNIVIGIILYLTTASFLIFGYRIAQWFLIRNITYNRMFGPPVGEDNIDLLGQLPYLSWMYLKLVSSILLSPEIRAIAEELQEYLEDTDM